MTRTPTRLFCLLLALTTAAFAQDQAAEPYFPLPNGQVWTYQLDLTRGEEKQSLVYTATVIGSEQLEGRDCQVIEHRSGTRLLQKTWYALDPDGTVRNPRRQNGGRIHVLRDADGDHGRVLLTPAALEAGKGSWSWRTPDGSAEGTIRVVGHERLRLPKPLRAELDCVVLLEEGTFKAGGRTATQERRIWLARGMGLVKETSTFRIGDEVVTRSEAYLIQFPRKG